jgi:WD40 repeat protein
MRSSHVGPWTPRRVAAAIVPVILAFAFMLPLPLDAQYFGRNKVQYDDFEWQVLTTPHFEIYYYPGMEDAISDVSRMAERWYERLARLFQHEFGERKPLIFYADHPDFQQTNTISAQLGEGTGGVTESLKNRVIMPISGSYASTDHVLGHELVHAFQYNLAQSRRGGGMPGLMLIPLWMIEGMAEYLSVGREDAFTAMWLRDALLRDDFPTLAQMTRETRFFPYRFGQAFWSYVGATYGDDQVATLFRASLRIGWDPAIRQVLGMSSDSLSAQWQEAAEAHYRPLMESRTAPGEVGTLLLAPSTGAGHQNVAPSVSPDGRRMVVMSEKDLFSFDLYLADARTGEILRTLHSASHDPHMDALRFIDSSGAWSPDGSTVAIVAFAQGRNEVILLDAERGNVQRRISFPEEIGEVSGPAFSPDGRTMVFSGQVGGWTDLFLVDLESEVVTRLTQDSHAAFQPTFSPDGRTVAFVSDRGPETDFVDLTYSEMRIAFFHMEDGRVETLDLFGNVRHSNPQFTPDGRSLYFLSDPDGFSDIYRVELDGMTVSRVTEVATGVSGITAMSPAMSVARETGTVVFSVFDEFQYHVYSMDFVEAPATPVVAGTLETTGRYLPPEEPRVPSRVTAYLADPHTALVPPGTFDLAESRGYRPSLSLDYIGQPMIGVGTDQFGNFVAGSAAAYFSDMLGDRVLGVAFQAQGTFKDIGGQFVYQNMANRWNWGVASGRIPYLQIRTGGARDLEGNTTFVQERLRMFQTQAVGLASYPFSTTRRVDFTGGVNRYSFDLEREFLVYDRFGRLIDRWQEDGSEGLHGPINLAQSSVALVGDNSFFGFTSPVRGGRYRLEAGTTIGTLNFHTLTLDYRRYFNPVTEVTVAFRGLHHGRYGDDVQGSVLQPLFLGWETYVRGYSSYSFQPSRECSASAEFGSCPEFERLFGHRVAVANAEVRVPLFGVDRYGLLDFSFLPTELIAFTDAGLAWDGDNEPALEFSRTSLDRIPVFSSGVGARINIFGFMVGEVYYAIPWQRPRRGAHWGFQLAPGW